MFTFRRGWCMGWLSHEACSCKHVTRQTICFSDIVLIATRTCKAINNSCFFRVWEVSLMEQNMACFSHITKQKTWLAFQTLQNKKHGMLFTHYRTKKLAMFYSVKDTSNTLKIKFYLLLNMFLLQWGLHCQNRS